MIYFTSDTHFNHRRIIELCHRPFSDVREMNEELIRRWNIIVTEYHEPVYVLGDFAFHYQDAPHLVDDIFHQLNGEKHLIVGNHDEQNRRVLRLPWKTVSQLEHIRYGEHRFIACHFPLERWWHMERGVIHVYGHCHGSLRRWMPHRYDVGADVQAFAPVTAKELIEKASAEPFQAEDYYV